MKTTLSWIEVCLTLSPQLSESCSSIIFEETGQGSVSEDPADAVPGPCRLRTYLPKDASLRDNLLKLKKRISDLHAYFPDIAPPLGTFARFSKRTGRKTGNHSSNPSGFVPESSSARPGNLMTPPPARLLSGWTPDRPSAPEDMSAPVFV